MGPRGSSFWEFWSLAFWWAVWTLADTYLLPFTPISEIAVVWICLLVAGVARLIDCVGRRERYTERIEDAEPERAAQVQPSKEPVESIIDAV